VSNLLQVTITQLSPFQTAMCWILWSLKIVLCIMMRKSFAYLIPPFQVWQYLEEEDNFTRLCFPLQISVYFFTIRGVISHQLFSELNLSLLEEVNIDVRLGPSKHGKSLMIMEWLQVVANVKILQFCLGALRKMLYVSCFSTFSLLFFFNVYNMFVYTCQNIWLLNVSNSH